MGLLCLWQCFLCVSTARPGKHFLIETEDEGGELEDGGPASDEDNQQNEQNNEEPITLNKSAGAL